MGQRQVHLEDKLRNNHRNLGTLGSSEALQERKRVCVSLGLLQNRHRHLVKSVYEVLPTTEDGETLPSEEDDREEGCAQEGSDGHIGENDCSAEVVAEHDDDQHMFITLAPSCQTSQSAFERTRKAMTAQASSKTIGKRPQSQRD